MVLILHMLNLLVLDICLELTTVEITTSMEFVYLALSKICILKSTVITNHI